MMAAWRLVNGLTVLRGQMKSAFPAAVQNTPVSAWGTIGDAAHDPSSDHSPHMYPALGSTPVVCAADFPHAPQWEMDGPMITESMRKARDPRVGYIICNRRITGPNHGWVWQTYTGSDPHDTHFHVSTVHTAVADRTELWTFQGQRGIDMAEFTQKQIDDVVYTLVTNPKGALHARLTGIEDNVKALREDVSALLARPASSVDTHALAQEIADLTNTNDASRIADLLAQRLAS
jgi:hypothetical protein